jgi:hypothetical protein
MNWKIVSGREDTVDTGQGFITCNTGSRAQSDARLVKAAPDMYEALRNLLKHPALTGLVRGELAERVNQAHAAIAKAEGK